MTDLIHSVKILRICGGHSKRFNLLNKMSQVCCKSKDNMLLLAVLLSKTFLEGPFSDREPRGL